MHSFGQHGIYDNCILTSNPFLFMGNVWSFCFLTLKIGNEAILLFLLFCHGLNKIHTPTLKGINGYICGSTVWQMI